MKLAEARCGARYQALSAGQRHFSEVSTGQKFSLFGGGGPLVFFTRVLTTKSEDTYLCGYFSKISSMAAPDSKGICDGGATVDATVLRSTRQRQGLPSQ